MNIKDVLKNEGDDSAFYKNYFYDAPKRKIIENFVNNEHHLNLVDKNNKSILHIFLKNEKIFKKENYVDEIIKGFLLFIIKYYNFTHLNEQDSQRNETPMSLALRYKRNFLNNKNINRYQYHEFSNCS